jgi:hypothetical protein
MFNLIDASRIELYTILVSKSIHFTDAGFSSDNIFPDFVKLILCFVS